jgi:hypothetical protein
MNFDFKAIAKTVPAICIVGGIFLIVIPEVTGSVRSLIGLGVFLLIAGIVLQVLYLYFRYRR